MKIDAYKISVISISFLCCCIVACTASGPEFRELEDLSDNKATVYVYRTGSLAGGAVKPRITINETEMCKLARGGYISKLVDPGGIVVSAKTEVTKEVAFDITPGQSIYVRIGIKAGVAMGRPKLTIVAEEEARGHITSCKKVCGD